MNIGFIFIEFLNRYKDLINFEIEWTYIGRQWEKFRTAQFEWHFKIWKCEIGKPFNHAAFKNEQLFNLYREYNFRSNSLISTILNLKRSEFNKFDIFGI